MQTWSLGPIVVNLDITTTSNKWYTSQHIQSKGIHVPTNGGLFGVKKMLNLDLELNTQILCRKLLNFFLDEITNQSWMEARIKEEEEETRHYMRNTSSGR